MKIAKPVQSPMLAFMFSIAREHWMHDVGGIVTMKDAQKTWARTYFILFCCPLSWTGNLKKNVNKS